MIYLDNLFYLWKLDYAGWTGYYLDKLATGAQFWILADIEKKKFGLKNCTKSVKL
jgi:hypothetical protein